MRPSRAVACMTLSDGLARTRGAGPVGSALWFRKRKCRLISVQGDTWWPGLHDIFFLTQ